MDIVLELYVQYTHIYYSFCFYYASMIRCLTFLKLEMLKVILFFTF